jgi:CheY-like chemotaxis protein
MGETEQRQLMDVRVLVVEDDDGARYVLEHYFRHHGAMVTTAASGSDALDIVRQVTPDVIISDIAMPGMTGVDLIRAVRALPGQREGPTPAIALSAQTLPYQRKEALEAGFDVFLVKPIDPRVVVCCIRALCDHPGSQETT